jgi:hypothetical protein
MVILIYKFGSVSMAFPGGRLFFASGPLNRKQKEKRLSVGSSDPEGERARDQKTLLS